MSYDLGAPVPLTILITDANGDPADATAVALTVIRPDNTTVTPTPVHSALGTYYYDYVSTQFGRHVVKWEATGTNAGVFTDVFHVRDPADLPIVGIGQVRDYLNFQVGDSSQDQQLQFFSDVATDLCERHRPIRRRTFTEKLSGGGPVVLTQSPVISIGSVTEDGTVLSGSDYFVDNRSGLLYKGTTTAPYSFNPGVNNVEVTYVAGYTDIPALAQAAVLEQTRHLYMTQRGSRPSFNGGSPDPLPGSAYVLTYRVQQLLDALGRVPGLA